MRLKAVERHLQGHDVFMANYSDGVSNLPLDKYVDNFMRSGKIACFVSVVPKSSFHLIKSEADGTVQSIEHIRQSGTRVNGGFFIFRKQIFDYIGEGEELVEAPFRRLIRDRQLLAYPYDGFWGCMDTYKEKQELADILEKGQAPWELWRGNSVDANS